MSRGAQTFRQADLTKALKGAVAAGINVNRVEIDRAGKTVVVAGSAGQGVPPNDANEWDNVK